jgi:signal transduction histidine kinase
MYLRATHGLALRTTLVLLLVGAAAYVAAICVYITWRLVPATASATAGTGACDPALLESAAADVVRAVRWWLLFAAALLPLLALFIHRRLYRPLAQLDAGLARIAAGDLTQTIVVEHDDEVGRLGHQFNEMASLLRQRADDERRHARRQTERLEAQLFERERLAVLGRMAGAIAHEIGAPLNSVLGHTQLLAKEELTDRGRRRLTIIESQVQRMVAVIRDYLARTRGAPVTREAIDVNALVRDALADEDARLRRAHVHRRVERDPAPLIVMADEDGLHRVLVNLIQNAVDAMAGPGTGSGAGGRGGQLTVVTSRVDPPDAPFAAAAIDVIDNGSGISPEARAKIFDLFFTTKPQGHGTGMGLSICQEIVKMLGGRIEVTSEIGRGTAMRVLLPRAGAAEAPDAQGSPDDNQAGAAREHAGAADSIAPLPPSAPSPLSQIDEPQRANP